MLKSASIVDVEVFIEQATRIVRKSKRSRNLSVEARQEARVLWNQFEKYLEATLKVLDTTADEDQLTRISAT